MVIFDVLVCIFAYYGVLHFTVYTVFDCIDFVKDFKAKHNKNREGN